VGNILPVRIGPNRQYFARTGFQGVEDIGKLLIFSVLQKMLSLAIDAKDGTDRASPESV
jgi:L-asparaginase II